MKKLFFGTLLLALVILGPMPAMAAVDVSVRISLPPPIFFAAPPALIVLPDTYVYVDPDLDVDIFFYNGWWWRLWEGRWYRSRYYNRGWGYYNRVPSFYFDIDPGWRGYYRSRNWYGHRWNYERIPYQQLQQNWKSWHDDRHWERQGTWGVQSYQPRPPQQIQELRQQRQQQYQQRPEVQKTSSSAAAETTSGSTAKTGESSTASKTRTKTRAKTSGSAAKTGESSTASKTRAKTRAKT